MVASIAIAIALVFTNAPRVSAADGLGYRPLTGYVGNLGSYTIRLRSSEGIESKRGYIQDAAAELSSITGGTFVVAPGTTTATDPVAGEILIEIVSAMPSGCSSLAIGCASPRLPVTLHGGKVATAGRVWISRDILLSSVVGEEHIFRHEIGHTLGLDHYDELHAGLKQMLHSRSYDAMTYRSGDRAGLRALYANRPTAPSGVAAPVVDTRSSKLGDGRINLSWNAPASSDLPVTGYVAYVYGAGSLERTVSLPAYPRTAVITGLANDRSYQVRVAGRSIAGLGPLSLASVAATPYSAPGAPKLVDWDWWQQSLSVGFSSPTSNGGSPVLGYDITARLDGTAVHSWSIGPDEVFFGGPLPQLTHGFTYTFSIAARNARGVGPEATTPGIRLVGSPPAPSGVTAVREHGSNSVVVAWTAPPSDGGFPITSYVITPYISGAAQPSMSSPATGTTKVIAGLTSRTAYTFKVAAVNEAGSGTQSLGSNFVTPSGSGGPYAPFTSWSALVKRQYVDLTTKQPTASQLSTWVSQLTAGTKTVGDLDDSLRRGDENLRNVDPVVRIYRAFLGRAPDAGGLKFWIARKRNVAPAKTWNVTQIAEYFTASNEFKAKYGSLTNRQFVTRIYTDVLGRTADTAGVNYWTAKIDSKQKTKAQVMVGFSESSEYKTEQAQNTDVAVAYIYLLGRAPNTTETNDWVNRQKAGVAHQVLLTELLEGNVYHTHVTG